MVEFISNEMERLVLTKDQLAQKRGADFGEDYFKDGSKASVSCTIMFESRFMGILLSNIHLSIYLYRENLASEPTATS